MKDRAACAGRDPKYWFPITGEDDEDGFEVEDYASVDAQIGIAICNTCPVFDWCRKRNAKAPYGIFFGTVPLERGMHEGKRTKRVTYK